MPSLAAKKSKNMTKKLARWPSKIEAVFVLALSAFVLLANSYDWDYVFSFGEVDRRSWLLDFTPPLWTYQLCGGVTRIGDPNSFGLSPLFSFVLVFGSFWGVKILVIFLMALGYLSMVRLLNYMTPGADEESQSAHRALAFSFFTSGFFLWHLGHGHVTFPLLALSVALICYLIKSTRESLSLVDKLLVFLLSFSFFTGPFYHAVLFFLVPLGLGAVFYCFVLAAFSFQRSKERVKNLFKKSVLEWLLCSCAGLLIGSYKVIGMIAYQSAHPRTLVDRAPETPPLIKLALDFFVPTWNSLYFGTLASLNGGIQEFSVFSPIAWLFGIALITVAFRALRAGEARLSFDTARLDSPVSFLCFGIGVTFLFCLGDRFTWLPFPVLNKLFLNNSARSVGRFQGPLLFELTLLTALFVHSEERLRKSFRRFGVPALYTVSLLSFLTYSDILSFDKFIKTLALPQTQTTRMKIATIVPAPDFSNYFMYPATLSGRIVLNCFEPLLRQMNVADSDGPLKPMQHTQSTNDYVLLEGPTPTQLPSQECTEKSWVTQNSLHLDTSSCAPGTCLNLNGLNPSESALSVSYSTERGKFCLIGNR